MKKTIKLKSTNPLLMGFCSCITGTALAIIIGHAIIHAASGHKVLLISFLTGIPATGYIFYQTDDNEE